MCPQLSLQVIMGVGTPTAWQVNVTVAPRATWTDSSGGLVTAGGAARSQKGQKTKKINAHLQNSWHVTGIWRVKLIKAEEVKFSAMDRQFSFSSGMEGSQKPCVSLNTCEKSLFHRKLGKVYKGGNIQSSVREVICMKIWKKAVECVWEWVY